MDRADVYKGPELVGRLERTGAGSRFTYAPSHLAAHGDALDTRVAFALPLRSAPYETRGANLHPFFAGLLPEGIRLRALVRAVKTSEDDLLSLLIESGADCIGDVSVVPEGVPLAEHTPAADLADPAALDFAQLFEQSLRYRRGGGDSAIAGVQRKVSGGMLSLPVRAGKRGQPLLLKLDPPDLPGLVHNEAFFMRMAADVGLEVAGARLVQDRHGETGLAVERFDRIMPGGAKLHQEDACQLLERYPADKYNVGFRQVLEAFEVCSAPVVERLEALELYAFCYLIANGDLHAKNVSVRIEPKRGHIALTPAYDLLSTLPYGDAHMALAMGGRDRKLHRAHFVELGELVQVRARATENMLTRLVSRCSPWLARLDEAGLEPRQVTHLQRTMQRRLDRLA